MSAQRGARRGSALILVLLMTLAVAGLAIAAIFLSSSAGLLSRFYDREREYRLASESAIEMIRARLERDTVLSIPDTGVVQLLAGVQVPTALGGMVANVRVNLYASITGDTTPSGVPTLTLIAAAYDAGGTRHVRRVDLRRESFSSYEFLADSVPVSVSFGPGFVNGRVHTNGTWRGGTGTAAPTFRDSVTAVTAVAGGGTYRIAAVTGVPRIRYPRDSTYGGLAARAAAANLSFTPGWSGDASFRAASHVQFVAVDADNDGKLEADEGFFRIFDLWSSQDTSRTKAGLNHTSGVFPFTWRPWNDPEVQNQCGAFYLRAGRWHFFPISTHRAAWARVVLQSTGASSFPSVTSSSMNTMDQYTYSAVQEIVQQPTARCFPAGSPFLMLAERQTDATGVVTHTGADTVPFGVVVPPGGWPLSAPNGYGGSDTTFTVRSRTCAFSTTSNGGRCDPGTSGTLGFWRAFGGTAVSGIPSNVRQAVELPYLWPIHPSRNANSRGVIYADRGPVWVSGTVRGAATLVVNGPLVLLDVLTAPEITSDTTANCDDRVGLLAVGDILVADNGITRGRRFGSSFFSVTSRHMGGSREFRVDASLMSLTGTVGVENPGVVSVPPQACPHDAAVAYSGGCLRIRGGAAMRIFSNFSTATNAGFMYAGSGNTCRTARVRPPYWPLTNRYTFVRALEVEPSQANTPAKLRALLLRLKGKPL